MDSSEGENGDELLHVTYGTNAHDETQVDDSQICVVMVGLPARGKSLIAQKSEFPDLSSLVAGGESEDRIADSWQSSGT